MHRTIIAVFVGIGMLSITSPAFARGGGWEADSAEPFDRVLCGASMHFEFPVVRTYYRIYTRAGDSVFVENGAFVDTITNLDNGRSVTVNNSGPVTFDISTQTLDAHGEVVEMLDPQVAARNHLPEFFVASGRLHATFDDDGPLLTIHGNVRDLCAELT